MTIKSFNFQNVVSFLNFEIHSVESLLIKGYLRSKIEPKVNLIQYFH